jgi:hypothetical protein
MLDPKLVFVLIQTGGFRLQNITALTELALMPLSSRE